MFHLLSFSHSQDIYIFILKFCSSRKTTWLERQIWFQNLWHLNFVSKQLQYTYWPISQEVKVIRHWNAFLGKSYPRFGGEIIPWPFSKKSKLSISLKQEPYVFTVQKQELADLVTFTEGILNEKLPFLCSVYVIFFIVAMPRWVLSKHFETKLQTACFYLI